MKVGFCISVFILLFSIFSFAAEPITLENGIEIYLPQNNLEYLEDNSGELTIDDIHSPEYSSQFLMLNQKTPNFGYKSSSIWIRFKIKNTIPEKRSWILEIAYPPLDDVEFYTKDTEGKFIKQSSGEKYKFKQRRIKYRNFAFLLPEALNSNEFYYLKIKTASVVLIPIRIISYEKFINIVNMDQLWVGIYFGATLVVVLYNLFLYISIRDIRYLWYVLFIFVWGISQFIWYGLAFEYFWPNAPKWADMAMPFFYALTSLVTLKFTQEFLETKNYSKLMNSVINIMLVLAGILTVSTLFIPYRQAIQLSDIMAVICASIFIISAFICWKNGFNLGVYYFSAFLVLAIGIAVNVVSSYALIPTGFITRHGVEIGFLLGVILISMGLGKSINILKVEIAEAETIARATKKLIHYFPRTLVYKIITSPEAELPTSARKEITVFFTDLMGFTDLSESHEPEVVKRILNEYLAEMQSIIDQVGATLDKFLGDGLMGYFGALDEFSKNKQAETASIMAIEMQFRLQDLMNKWKNEGISQEIKMRIGIHQDFVTIGNFGSSELMSYTAIGNGVNLASRLEYTCTPGKIQVSKIIYELTKDKFPYEEPQEKQLKGFSQLHFTVELDPEKIRPGKK
ncbi:MAG: 7TM diverse intracellular signaling domain-containing protein [bacterium]|nr:7TM diverse intracellular signaling domain-containing protein [bacterium]